MVVGVDGRSLVGPGRGVARYTCDLVAALAAAHPEDDWRVLIPAGDLVAVPADVRAIRSRLPSRVLFGLSSVFGRPRLDRLLGGVDVLWAPAPAPLAISKGVPLVLTVHDLSWELRPGDFTGYERLWHRAARMGTLARRATRVMAVSDATREQAVRAWGLDPGRVLAVSPGLRVPRGPPEEDAIDDLRRRHALPARYFLSVGALEPRKGLDVLVRAFSRVRAAGEDAALAIVGEGRVGRTLAAPGVRVLGRVSDPELDCLYAGALALVMPSRLEGFGLPPLEAALRGTPSIVSDLPVFGETLGETAVRVPPDDEAALATALADLGADAGLRADLADRALAAARAFTLERASDDAYGVLATAAAER